MVKTNFFTPAFCIVTLATLFTLLTLVHIINPMTTIAVTGELLFVGIGFMAGLAGNPGVFSL
jgi:hypothetical protein